MSFAAAMLGAAGATRRTCKPSKCGTFRFPFDAVIVLDNPTLNPYARLNGQLTVDSEWPIFHNGLRIQLEAQCSLKFQTKLDNRISFHTKYDSLLQGSQKEEKYYRTYTKSPVFTDIFPVKGDEEEQYEMPAGSNRYRFSLQATGEFLPAPFKTSYGSLVYKLVAYALHSSSLWVEIGEKVLQFSGYYNLSQNMEAVKPVQVERSIKKSIFSSKRIVTATLDLEGCGYLANEELPFKLSISNPKCLPLKISVKLLQKSVYNIDGAKKATVAVLGGVRNDISEPGTTTTWSGVVKIHKAASPSYSVHQMHKVSHELEFKMKVEDYGSVKGEFPIFIGTTREPEELLMASENSLKVWNDRIPLRRGSASSIYSVSSGLSTFTLPPAYSQLSSRAPSLETLPPPYNFEEDEEDYHDNDVQTLEGKKNGKGQRNLSHLEFRVVPPEEENDLSGNSSPLSISNKTPATSPTEHRGSPPSSSGLGG